MPKFTFIFLLLIVTSAAAQPKTTLYFLPGEGADHRLFDSLRIDTAFEKRYLDYGTPAKNTGMREFAEQLAAEIDTGKPFVLIGVSLGGMLCVEMGEILHPEKVIIISSAKNRNEFPLRYRFQKTIPLYAIFPAGVVFAGAKFLQPLVEPDSKKYRSTFKSMLYAKSPRYIKRTVKMVLTWDRETNTQKAYHIHGTRDHTLPYRKIRNADVTIRDGSHVMTLTRATEVSRALNSLLLIKQ